MGLSAADLASIQGEAALFLPQTAKIERPTDQNDGAGGFGQAWAVVAAAEKCRVVPPDGDEMFQVGREQVQVQAQVKFRAGADVTERDRLVIDGTVYDVLHIVKQKWGVFRIVKVAAPWR